MDSPRGRIHLVGQALEGEPMTASFVTHIDRCLGCMACVTACPSGVQYDRIIETTRAQVERNYPRPLRDRLLRAAIFAVFPYPRRLRALRGPLRAYQRSRFARWLRRNRLLDRFAPRLATMDALLPPPVAAEPVPERTPAAGRRRGTVGLLLGCVQREFFPHVNAATARVLAAEGFEVVAPPHQGCCGALSVHNGRAEEARRFARRLVDAFTAADVDWVVVNAAGCGSTMKEYADLLDGDPCYAERAREFATRVRDFSELLAEQGSIAARHRLPLAAAYHDACHLAHAQRVRAQPRALLAEIPELEVREIADPDICCGSAGIYNLLHPEAAAELGERKARAVLATGADVLVTANPGCLMQIAAAARRMAAGAERPFALVHTAQVLDASIRGLDARAFPSSDEYIPWVTSS
jgi:glycolate oxidase iron-sulfur subunit